MKISKLNDKKFRTEIELEILRYNGVREYENLLKECMLFVNQSKQLTSEQIADYFLSDIDAYKDNIRDIIIKHLNNNKESKIYWDAWFRGAENEDLEKADKGIIFKK